MDANRAVRFMVLGWSDHNRVAVVMRQVVPLISRDILIASNHPGAPEIQGGTGPDDKRTFTTRHVFPEKFDRFGLAFSQLGKLAAIHMAPLFIGNPAQRQNNLHIPAFQA